MEKTIDRKMRNHFFVHTSDVVCAGIAMLLGSLSSPIGSMFTFLFVICIFLKGTREAGISVFFLLLSALCRGVIPAYFYALGFTSLFIVVEVMNLRNANLHKWIPLLSVGIILLFSLFAYGWDKKAVIMPIVAYILLKQIFTQYQWIDQEASLPTPFIAMVVMAAALGLVQLAPNYREMIILIAVFNMIFICDSKSAIALLLLIGILIPMEKMNLLLLAGILALFKEEKSTSFFLLVLSAFFLIQDIQDSLYLMIAAIALFFIVRPKEVHTPIKENRSDNNLVKRQMNNYAAIFQMLSDYYAQFNNVEAEILANMSTALQYNAKSICDNETKETNSEHIKKCLEGYQYNIKECTINESCTGNSVLELEIENLVKEEVDTTLLPLLEALTHRMLQVEQIQNNRWHRSYHIVIKDRIPFAIDAYGESIKNAFTSNGDTYSIFRFRQSVVCMICDGMGNGEVAMNCSRLITSIFQRMMIAGIPQDNAIQCINQLIQSDSFATLDVLCFNKAQGMVTISKSAACPTYLLREDQLYEVSGSALPVGIISQIQPDCFQIKYHAQDEYLMVSDGVSFEEIQQWRRSRNKISVKEDIELFKQILMKRQRNDDSTIILIKVDEIVNKIG